MGPVKSAQTVPMRECPTFYGHHPLWITHTAPGILITYTLSNTTQSPMYCGNIDCTGKCVHNCSATSDTYHRPIPIRVCANRTHLCKSTTPSPLWCIVQSYWQENVLLVTHSPTRTTTAQFWRTVLDSKCSTIITISQSNKVKSVCEVLMQCEGNT